MKMNEIMQALQQLANSQGTYTRIYAALLDTKENDPEAFEQVSAQLEEQNFKDTVDMVLFFET